MAKRRRARGKRYSLLIYRRLFSLYAGPLFLLFLISAAPLGATLVWELPGVQEMRWTFIIVAVVAALLWLALFIARWLSFVRCRTNSLLIQVPLYQVVVSYGRIRHTRPVQLGRVFPPQEQSWSQRRFLEPLWGKTVIVVETQGLPLPRWWLRLWLSKYLLLPDGDGFVFAVKDWMRLGQEIDSFRSNWLLRRK
ncbi:MAG: hypothetical protein H5T62_16055 [Anaerolineae bacterium]|nr:hypothetical protein [Anaerolineae bacterium]